MASTCRRHSPTKRRPPTTPARSRCVCSVASSSPLARSWKHGLKILSRPVGTRRGANGRRARVAHANPLAGPRLFHFHLGHHHVLEHTGLRRLIARGGGAGAIERRLAGDGETL